MQKGHALENIFLEDIGSKGTHERLTRKAVHVQGEDKKKVCFVDRGVYTKNRAFRLMLSSKAGKATMLQPTGQDSYRLLPQINAASYLCKYMCDGQAKNFPFI